ncbi:MAG: anti-sigma F factor [Oscillospiraceae bacterium]|nr:anti-sigma F factor [Oscillospiraceae bacterium]
MKVINEMRLTLTSRSANEGLARAAVATLAAQLDPTLDELGDIKTAVSEAVTNCVVHAYPDSIGRIYIMARLFEGGVIEIAVRDTGLGIPDVEKARKAMFTTGGSERSGMGFTIMESFTDSLRVRSVPGKGTTVVMRKRLALRASGVRAPEAETGNPA